MENLPQARKNNLIVQEYETEVLIYDLQINKAFCLNQIAALVWQCCDGNRSIQEISMMVSKSLKANVNEDLIWIALDQLKREKLLEDSHKLKINFNGLSRREVIKKVGLSSMIALPLVASIMAPSSISAQSSVCRSSPGANQFNNGAGCPCNSSDDCCAVCGGAVGMMTCGGTNALDAPAICFGIICTVPAGQAAMNVIDQCPCNTNADCVNVCGGSVGMMICG